MQNKNSSGAERFCEEQLVSEYTCSDKSPAYLLEDVISADVFDVLVDNGSRALFFSELLLQPRHHLLVVLPQIGLNKERGA